MENFINLKPKDIKILKEHVNAIMDMNEETELVEEDIQKHMELVDFFQDIADDLKTKIYDITGYNSEDETEEEAEEEKEAKEEN